MAWSLGPPIPLPSSSDPREKRPTNEALNTRSHKQQALNGMKNKILFEELESLRESLHSGLGVITLVTSFTSDQAEVGRRTETGRTGVASEPAACMQL